MSYKFDDPALQTIINGTHTAIQDMNTVNGRVLGISGQLPAVNRSESGQRLANALGDWYADFTRVINSLNVLNEKATGLLRANRDTNAEASSASNAAG